MKRALLYLTITYFGSAVSGQTINLDSIFEPKLCGEIFHMRTGTVGKQFYNDVWEKSDIRLNSGEYVTNKQLKYNTYEDEVIWFQPDSFREVKLEKHFIDEFYFKNENKSLARFRRIQFKLPQMTDSSDIFVEVLFEKRMSLFAFRNVKVEGTLDRVEKGIMYSFDKLVPNPLYILNLPQRRSAVFKRIRRNAILKSLPVDYKAKVKEIIQQNHLSIRNEQDLIKLMNLIDA
jgi:hypothetical protein